MNKVKLLDSKRELRLVHLAIKARLCVSILLCREAHFTIGVVSWHGSFGFTKRWH